MVRCYFDYVSPYAYLGYRRLLAVAADRGLRVLPVPIVFGALLDAQGNLGPAEIPSKRRYVFADVLAQAKKYGLPLAMPAAHPFRSLDALRLSLREVSGEDQAKVIDVLWAVCWVHGQNPADKKQLATSLSAAGLDAEKLLRAASAQSAKDALRKNTEEALAAGVFGVPTFVAKERMFWGADRIDELAELLDGTDRLSEADWTAVDNLPVGVSRAGAAKPTAGPAPTETTAESVAERVERIFHSAPFMRWLSPTLQRVEHGKVQCDLRVRAEFLQQDGFVHAGIIAALADHTAGAAAGSCLPPQQTPLTIEYKINLLRAAQSPSISCEARVLRPGRTVSVVEAEVFEGTSSARGKLLAKSQYTMGAMSLPGA